MLLSAVLANLTPNVLPPENSTEGFNPIVKTAKIEPATNNPETT